MDAGASAVTLVATALAVAKQLYMLCLKLKNAPQEIITLFEEVQNIRIILTDIQNKEQQLASWIDVDALSIIVRRAVTQLEEVQKFLAQFVQQNDRDELVFKRFDWYRKRDEAKKLSGGFRAIQMNAVAVLSCAQL
jgi:16S rRNA G527 N7-methylase RsmG